MRNITFLLMGTSSMDKITKEKLEKYFDVTGRALKKVKIAKERKINWKANAEDFLDMATRYFEDAKHFEKKNDIVTSFAALNYAHGWLDAGARLGLFDVDHDSELFTVD
jgi:uncharacterized protein